MIRTDEEILAALEFEPNRLVLLQAIYCKRDNRVPHIFEITQWGRRQGEVWHCEEVQPSFRPTLGQTVPILAGKGLKLLGSWTLLGADPEYPDLFDYYVATAEVVL